MKYKYQGNFVPSKFGQKIMEMRDTLVSHIELEQFVKGTFAEDVSPTTKKIANSQLAHIASFPIVVQCPKFILVVAYVYNSTQRKCIDSWGNNIIDFPPGMMRLIFDLPPYPNLKIITEAQYQKYVEGNKAYINKRWIKTKKSIKKLPTKLKRYNFSVEVGKIITLLSKEFGKRDSHAFQDWMFPFIQIILDGKQYLNQGQMVSNTIHNQITKVKDTKTFCMNSYVIYCATRMVNFLGLTTLGVLREEYAQNKVCQYYDQLELKMEKTHFKRVNDAFLYVVIN